MTEDKDSRRRPLTTEDAINLPDYVKVDLFNSHADLIIESCDLHWSDEPAPEHAVNEDENKAKDFERYNQYREMLGWWCSAAQMYEYDYNEYLAGINGAKKQ